MRLRTRLLLFGAVIPLALLIAALALAGLVFDREMLAEHDRALLGQAGTEAVSLFDRANAPHLHLNESPLDSQLRDFAPRGALYGPDGAAITRFPIDAPVPERVDPRALGYDPTLRTVEGPSGRDRQLLVRVDGPDGEPHALWLAASLERHDREIASYWRIAVVVLSIVGAVLLLVQIVHGRRLSDRVLNLTEHMRKLRSGTLERPPPEDPGSDEIAELRAAIAETSERLAAARTSQDRLIADAAHELRTPMAALRAGIDVALRRERTTEELRQALTSARVEVDRLGELAGSLLDLASLRASALERRRANLVDTLVVAVDAARALAEARGCVVRLAAPGEAIVEHAPGALRQALDNLLHNAIAFSPADAVIDVTLDRVRDQWVFSVEDRGPGVPESARERIFEPFHRLDRARPGAGLGLAIVRDVAERHRGTVHVEARDTGPGARFVFALPAERG